MYTKCTITSHIILTECALNVQSDWLTDNVYRLHSTSHMHVYNTHVPIHTCVPTLDVPVHTITSI